MNLLLGLPASTLVRVSDVTPTDVFPTPDADLSDRKEIQSWEEKTKIDDAQIKNALKDVDFLGIGLLAIAVGSLQYVLEHGQQDDWFENYTILILSIISGFGFFFFIWREFEPTSSVIWKRLLRKYKLRLECINKDLSKKDMPPMKP